MNDLALERGFRLRNSGELKWRTEDGNEILSGEKRYEYRRGIPSLPVGRILIYETKPVGKYVAVAEVREIIKGTPKEIWDSTHEFGGIDERSFMTYFTNTDRAYAYKLGRVVKLPDNDISFPTVQSYMYLPRGYAEELMERYGKGTD